MGNFPVERFHEATSLGPVGMVISLLVGGMVALGIELFILPGFGVAGIVGIVALFAGVVSAWVQFGAFWGSVTIVGTLIMSTAMVVFTFKSKRVKKRFVLDTQLKHGDGTASFDLQSLVGKTGVTHTDLRPAGIVTIDGERLDVVSDGGYIEKSTTVKVIEIDGPRVIVSRTENE